MSSSSSLKRSMASVVFTALCLAVGHSFSIVQSSHSCLPSRACMQTSPCPPMRHPLTTSASQSHTARMSPLFSSTLSPQDDQNNNDGNQTNPAMLPRRVISATTGLSLSAFRTTLRTLTGVSISALFKKVIGVLPPSLRYFVQPFLILYYTPLTIMKAFIGSTKNAKSDARASHEKLVEGWRDALRAADAKIENWPIHVAADGTIDTSSISNKNEIADAIVEAVEMRNEEQNRSRY